MITLIPTGGKLSSAPCDVTLPSGCFQMAHTETGAFALLPFLQGYFPRMENKKFLCTLKKKKIAAIALILLAVSNPFVSHMDDL